MGIVLSGSASTKLKYTWWFLYPITAIAVGWYLYGRIMLGRLYGSNRNQALDAMLFDILHNNFLVALLFVACYLASCLWLSTILILFILGAIALKTSDWLKVILMLTAVILFWI
jgi:hypothetical protein